LSARRAEARCAAGGGLNPFGERARVDAYAAAGIEALAMEFMPRITRAQSMDVLSSQSNLPATRRCSMPPPNMAGPSR
jgi:NAD/NADP transhydrogenase alpha subunit